MQQTQIDGVPVFLADVPGPLSAGLVFGVGRSDETFVQGGITHLVEHLAMHALGRRALDCNASVDLQVTEFTASGSPERVGEFLRDVCAALADLPVDRLAVEADVLRTENGAVTGSALATLLETLYGASGPGLAASREPAMLSLHASDVHRWAARWFTRANASLWLTGPVPEGLTLPLPAGGAPARSGPERRPVRTPAWTEHPTPGSVAVGAELDDRPATGTALAVLRERVEDELRHRRGVTYTVATDRTLLVPGREVVAVLADVRQGHEPLAARVLWQQLARLADEGPAEAELARAREELSTVLDDPRATAGEAGLAARHRVLGLPPITREELRRTEGKATPDDVRAVAAALRDAAILCVPPDVAAAPPGLDRVPLSTDGVVEGRAFARRRLSDAPRGSRLVVGERGVSLVRSGDDEDHTVLWPDVVGLVRVDAGTWCLVARHGFSIPLVVEEWRGGEKALAAVREHVPLELQVTDDGAVSAEAGLLLFRAPRERVEEAVRLFRTDAEVLGDDEWTAVRPLDGGALQELQSDVICSLGRRATTLVLWQDHTDLEYVLLRGTKPVHAHSWAGGAGDPAALAAATDRDPELLRSALESAEDPQDLLAALVTVLGLPAEVPDLLAGRAVPTARRVSGLGFVGAMRAIDADADPAAAEAGPGFVERFREELREDAAAPGTGSVLDRWLRLGRSRPGWYRGVNAIGAAVCALLLWLLTSHAVGPDGWIGVALEALVAGGLLGCLFDTRPPPRPAQAGGSAPARGTSSGASTVMPSAKQ